MYKEKKFQKRNFVFAQEATSLFQQLLNFIYYGTPLVIFMNHRGNGLNHQTTRKNYYFIQMS